MKAEGIPVDLPDNPLPYLTDWLIEIGPLATGGMGPAPLDWSDIANWQSLVGIRLDAWEARTIRKLSREFLDQMTKAKKPECPAPYSTGAVNEEAVTEQFRKMFRFASSKPTKEGSR
jgi:hypothetical protein